MIEQLINSPKMYKIHSKMFENVQYSYSPSITVLVLAIKLFAVLILAINFLHDKVLVLVIGYSYPTLVQVSSRSSNGKRVKSG